MPKELPGSSSGHRRHSHPWVEPGQGRVEAGGELEAVVGLEEG